MLARIVEIAPVPIFVKDLDGIYLYVNAAFPTPANTGRIQLIGQKDEDLFPEATAAAFRREDVLAMTSTEPIESTWPVEVDSEQRLLRTVKFPVRSEAGEIAAICGVSLERTDRLVGQVAPEGEEKGITARRPFERLLASLTPQEARIAELLLQGLSDKEIAQTLFLTPGTIRHHVSRILKKLRRRSRTQVVVEMLRHRARR